MAVRLRIGRRSGLNDGDPGLDLEAIHQEGEWNASMSPVSSFKNLADVEHVAAHHSLVVRPHRSGNSSPSMQAHVAERAPPKTPAADKVAAHLASVQCEVRSAKGERMRTGALPV